MQDGSPSPSKGVCMVLEDWLWGQGMCVTCRHAARLPVRFVGCSATACPCFMSCRTWRMQVLCVYVVLCHSVTV